MLRGEQYSHKIMPRACLLAAATLYLPPAMPLKKYLYNVLAACFKIMPILEHYFISLPLRMRVGIKMGHNFIDRAFR